MAKKGKKQEIQPLVKSIILNKGGTEERRVKLRNVVVPDLWPVIERLGYKTPDGQAVDTCWHLCHDLLRTLKGEDASRRAPSCPRP